jgi:hypothetical protein
LRKLGEHFLEILMPIIITAVTAANAAVAAANAANTVVRNSARIVQSVQQPTTVRKDTKENK